MNQIIGAKRRKKPNAIDILIFTLILFAVAFAFYFFYLRKSPLFRSKEQIPIAFTVTLEIVDNTYHGSVKEGDEFIDAVRSFRLGEVSKVEYAPSTFTGLNQETGELEIYEYPGHEEMRITVKGTAKLIGNQYNINGYVISVGTKVSFRTPGFLGTGFCTDFTIPE